MITQEEYEEKVSKLRNIVFPGSLNYWEAYSWGQALDAAFPGQEASELASAILHNNEGPMNSEIYFSRIDCLKVGEPDGRDWEWTVLLSNGTMWKITAWCDFTGWDCQSGIEWEEIV